MSDCLKDILKHTVLWPLITAQLGVLAHKPGLQSQTSAHLYIMPTEFDLGFRHQQFVMVGPLGDEMSATAQVQNIHSYGSHNKYI